MCRTIISDCSCSSLLQDCHVLTFSSTGSVSDHLVLHPQLATGNFIIKAIWLPGSQTELAIITADFVKARSNKRKRLFLIYLASLLLNENIFDFVILFVLLAVCEMNIVELVILISICFFLKQKTKNNRFMTCPWMPSVPCTTSCCQVPKSATLHSFSMKRGRVSLPSCPQRVTCTLNSWMNPAVPSMALSMSQMYWR